MAKIVKIDQNTWRIEDDGVRFFLLTGTQKALMIDSGMNTPNALDIVRPLTELPIELLNTHGDRDHVSGNDSFVSFYMSPNELTNFESKGKNGSVIPVKTGDVIDLGDRELEIIDNPGHTPGSIAILDIRNRVLYSGDAIQDSRIFMFGPARDMDQYILSLKNMKNYIDRFDTIYPSHGSFPVKPDLIDKLIEGAESVQNGSAQGKPTEFFGNEIMVYQFDYAGFLCPKK